MPLSGARTPAELWENVLARRKAFRRMPPERLRLEDYLALDTADPDGIYSTEAAVIEDYEFDRVRFRVAGSTYRAADLAHWLALEVAAQALADAGFPDAQGLPRDAFGVLVGNSLTGEFSRANLMRLRWPYVRRVLAAALHDEGWRGRPRRGFPGGPGDNLQGAVPAAVRGVAGRRALEHDRRADLQPLRPARRRLHGGRRLRLVAAGRGQGVLGARRRAIWTWRWPAAWT